MKKLIHLVVPVYLISLLFFELSNAQVGGIIKDSRSFEPVSEVHIIIEGTQNGTSSNDSGEFSLPVSSYPVFLKLSALGYEGRRVEVFRADTNLVFFLKPTVLGMEEIVVSPDRTLNPITNSSPIARSSVTIEQISDKSVTTAVELLRAESGVFVQQTSVGQGSLYIRGRAGRDVLYLFNGMRMNPSFVRSGQNQYFGALDPLLLNKIDVYRGPISVYYGSDALSGGVNISPIVRDYSSKEGISGEVLSTLNFEGNGEKTIHGKLAYQSPRFSLFVGGSYRDFNYYKMSSSTNDALWFPYDQDLTNADYQFKSFQLASKIKTTENIDLTLVSYYGEIPDAPRIDRVTLGYSIEESLASDESISPQYGYYSNTSPLTFWGNTAEFRTAKINDVFESIGIKFGYFKLRDFRKEQDFAFNDYPEFSVESISRTFSLSDTTDFDRNTSNQFQFSIDIRSALAENLYLKWGGDISYDYVNSQRISSTGETSLPRYPDGSNYILSGLFAQIDQVFSKELSLEYGIRYSHTFAKIPFEGVLTDRKYDPYSSNYGQVTGSLGITYMLSKELAFLSNISTGFRAPNVSDLSEVGIRRTDQFQTPNTDLKPEKTGNFDIGFQYKDDLFYAEVFTFWLHYFDKINRVQTGNTVNEFGEIVPNAETSSNDVFDQVRNENVNSMDLLGIEFKGDYTISDDLKSGLTFTYTWGNLTNEDGSTEPADRVPPTNGVFYVSYEPFPKLSIRPQARYAFAHRRISPDEVGDIRVSENGTDGFVNVQLLMNYRAKEHLAIKVIADNLADASYREHASSLDGMGRNITFTVTYSF